MTHNDAPDRDAALPLHQFSAPVGLLPTMADIVGRLVDDYDLTEVLQVLVERSVDLFEADAAGLLLAGASGKLQIMAATGTSAEVLELFQLQHREGPCLDSVATGEPVLIDDLALVTGRWPAWAPMALALGFHAVSAVPLVARGQVFGAMNMFSRRPLGLHGDALAAAEILTHVASIVVVHERSRTRDETLIEQLETALSSRVVIEQAKGVLSERLGISLQDAFAMLRTRARDNGMRVAVIAGQVVEHRGGVPT